MNVCKLNATNYSNFSPKIKATYPFYVISTMSTHVNRGGSRIFERGINLENGMKTAERSKAKNCQQFFGKNSINVPPPLDLPLTFTFYW